MPNILSAREVEAIVDPQVRAVRSIAALMADDDDVRINQHDDRAPLTAYRSDPGPVLLRVKEVAELTSKSRTFIYENAKVGTFPEQIKIGGSARWRKSEVLTWINEQAAKRGD